jgi:hypothetical protein
MSAANTATPTPGGVERRTIEQMRTLSETDLLTALLALAVILILARTMAEVARRVGQPEVLGELFAGFLLGPSVFGALAPSVYGALMR